MKIVSRISETKMEDGVQVCNVSSLSKDEFMKLECEKANTIISLLSDEDNLKICEIAYENLGTKNIIVRLNERDNYDKFIDTGDSIISLAEDYNSHNSSKLTIDQIMKILIKLPLFS